MRLPFSHRPSYYPVIVAVLTIGLLGLMYYSFSYRASQSTSQQEQVKPISSDEYRDSVRSVLNTFDQKIAVAQDTASRRAVIQDTMNSLLALRVPVEFQSVHLRLALALNAMQAVLDSENPNIDNALAQWREAADTLK